MGGSEPEKQSQFPRVLADLHWITQAMTCDHGRETVVRTGEAPSLGPTPQAGFPPADRIALTGEVSGGNPSGVVPRLNRRPYGRGHGAQEHGESGGDGRGVSNFRSAAWGVGEKKTGQWSWWRVASGGWRVENGGRPNGGVRSRYRFRFCQGIGRCIASRVY